MGKIDRKIRTKEVHGDAILNQVQTEWDLEQ